MSSGFMNIVMYVPGWIEGWIFVGWVFSLNEKGNDSRTGTHM